MKRTIRELREARGLKQIDLASQADISPSQLCRIESLAKGPPPDVLQRLCRALECQPQDVLTSAARQSGGQLKVAREELRLLRQPPVRMQPPPWTSACRLATLRRDLPQFMRRMEATVARWEAFLQEVPSESRDETILQLLELSQGAMATSISTAGLGFDLWPVCDQDGRGAATCLRPALVTADWVMLFQVWLIAGRRWRLDGLLLVRQPQPTCINVEVDGEGHDSSHDERRTRALGMVTLRIPGPDLLRGPSLTERLQEMGYCLPRRRSRVQIAGLGSKTAGSDSD